MGNKVMCAMSGGVDSSVAALLLQMQGMEVCGVTMRLLYGSSAYPDTFGNTNHANDSSMRNIADAEAVCARLGIEHKVFDFREIFTHEVIERFCDAYLGGFTPNPCIDCNRYIKFAALQKKREEFSYDYIATGHYARIGWDERQRRYYLRRAADLHKDQSYVLFRLSQNDLAHFLFPLGGLTKREVRNMARRRSFEIADRKDSQDICFVPGKDYASFIEKHLGLTFEPGDICDIGGKVLGRHSGLAHYTIGQRKGIGIAAKEPLYVLSKSQADNRLIVGPEHELYTSEITLKDINYVSVDESLLPRELQAKTSYRGALHDAYAHCAGELLTIHFKKRIIAPAAGQSCVLYKDDYVLAGGTIV